MAGRGRGVVGVATGVMRDLGPGRGESGPQLGGGALLGLAVAGTGGGGSSALPPPAALGVLGARGPHRKGDAGSRVPVPPPGPAASLTQNFLQTRGPPSRPAPAPPAPRVRALLPRPPCRAPCWRRAVTIRGRRAPHGRIGRPPLTRCDGHRVPGPAPGRGNPSAPRPAPRGAEQLGCVGGSAADQGQGGGAGPPRVGGKCPRPSLPEPEPAARDAGPAVTEQLAGGPGGLEGRAGGGASWVRHLGCRNKALLTAGCALPGPRAPVPVPEAGALTGRGRGWGSPGLSPARAVAICPAAPHPARPCPHLLLLLGHRASGQGRLS